MQIANRMKKPRRGMVIIAMLLLLTVAGFCEALNIVVPMADGTRAWKESGATLDASHAESGYVMIKKSSGKKLKVRVIRGETTYTYDLAGDGEYEVYPLQLGSGSYKIAVYENVKGNKYAQLLSKNIEVEMDDEMNPFLCPNRYVDYNAETKAVNIAAEIAKNAKTDKEKAQAVLKWMKQNFRYDYIAALTVQTGYIPDNDRTVDTGTGMCFDFASIMCTMLRSQGVPTKLVMGDADGTYHAWCDIWIDGKWVMCDPTAEINGEKADKYIEEAFY